MRVGITYDLREDYLGLGLGEEELAEFDRPDTIDAIDDTLQTLGYTTDRIGHVKSLTQRLARGERWDLVFNIAEGRHGYGREAQVPALLDAYRIPYTFSDPLTLSLTLHKGMAKQVVRGAGLPTPDFVVVKSDQDLGEITLPFPLFAKPVAEGTGKGVTAASKVGSRAALPAQCARLWSTYQQPVLVETYLPGREFTVGIIGTGREAQAAGMMEVILREHAEPHAYSFQNKERCEELVEYRAVPEPLAAAGGAVALAAWCALEGRDAGRIDLRADGDGCLHFLEANPLPGLHPEHSDLPILCTMAGVSYQELLARIMASALRRVRGEG